MEAHHVAQGPGMHELYALMNIGLVVFAIIFFGRKTFPVLFKNRSQKTKESLVSAREELKKISLEIEKETLIKSVEEEGKVLAQKLIDEAQASAKRIKEDSSNAVSAEFAEMRKKYKEELLGNVFEKIRAEFSNENSRQKLHDKLIEGFLAKTENSSRGVRV
jgi:F0F1-type ATP synthase membrane subunit b/b'